MAGNPSLYIAARNRTDGEDRGIYNTPMEGKIRAADQIKVVQD